MPLIVILISPIPIFLLFENVAALVSKKFIKGFNKWQLRLEGMGYANFQKLLNAKDYGVPQNRLRIYMVSIRMDGGEPRYHFPEPFPLRRKLCDVLESDVEEKYYLSAATMKRLQRNTEKEDFTVKGDTAHTVCSQSWKMTSFDNYIGG